MQQDQPQTQVGIEEIVATVGELTIENRFLRRKIIELEQQLAAANKNGEVKAEAVLSKG